MNRPGPVGLTILVAFSIPVIIEIRTIMAMLGYEIPASIFFPVAALIVALAVGLVLLLPEDEEDSQGNETGEATPGNQPAR